MLGPLRGCVVAYGPRPSAFPERGRLTVMRLHNRGALRWPGFAGRSVPLSVSPPRGARSSALESDRMHVAEPADE